MNHELVHARTALDLVRPARIDRVVTLTWSVGLVLAVLVLWLTPWQQTAPGTGRVIAYAPEERRQNIEAPLEGRIARWHVREGDTVQKGDPLVDLIDNDPELVARLGVERDSVVTRMQAARERAQAL
jgi:multidrug efflux pump subunit AcrA (membrane-fusion protein)